MNIDQKKDMQDMSPLPYTVDKMKPKYPGMTAVIFSMMMPMMSFGA